MSTVDSIEIHLSSSDAMHSSEVGHDQASLVNIDV